MSKRKDIERANVKPFRNIPNPRLARRYVCGKCFNGGQLEYNDSTGFYMHPNGKCRAINEDTIV